MKIYNDIVKKNTENIIFFFYPGRTKRLEIIDDISTEFFYSFIEAKETIENVKLIEVENTQNNLQRLMKFYDRIIFKICRIQSNSEKFCEKKYKDLLDPKNILIFTNFALGLSALPFLMKNIFRKRNDIFVINSGLFSFRKANSIQKLLRSIYLRLLFNLISKMIFTSKTEYLFAVDMFPKYENKFVLNEFCPDFRFWNKDAASITKEKVDILFIGNDEGRYFELLEPLAEALSELKFTFITNNKEVNLSELPEYLDEVVTVADLAKVFAEAIGAGSGPSGTTSTWDYHVQAVIGDVVGDDNKERAAIWKNGNATILKTPMDNKSWASSFATGIAIHGNDIYVSGNYLWNENDWYRACYWKNGQFQTLDKNSEANGIAVKNGVPITVGHTYKNGKKAVKWVGKTKKNKANGRAR